MPIIAIGAAALAIGTAATGIAAAGLTLVTALEAVAAVGATLGAVGAVTGDKTLGTIGMVLGAVGGIGSLAASAGLFGASAATAPLFGESATAIGTTEVTAANDLSNLGSYLPDLTNSGVADPLASVVAGSQGTTVAPDVFSALGSGSSAAPAAATDAAGLEGGANASASVAPAQVGSAVPATSQIPSPASTGLINQSALAPNPTESVTVTAPTAPNAVAPVAPVAPSVPVAANDTGVLGGISKFAKDNPLVAYGVVQAAGSFIAGATNPLTPAQVSALNAQAAANQANANLTAQQVSNMGQPIPVATRVKGGTGLINYVPQNAVTGQVAA